MGVPGHPSVAWGMVQWFCGNSQQKWTTAQDLQQDDALERLLPAEGPTGNPCNIIQWQRYSICWHIKGVHVVIVKCALSDAHGLEAGPAQSSST